MDLQVKYLLAVAMFCGATVALHAANPVRTAPPNVVVVEPMCAATEWWGQNKDNTHDGYLGDYLTGCDATAWGQILTYYGRKGAANGWTFTPSSNYAQKTADGTQYNLELRTTGTLVTSQNINGNNNTTGTRVSTTTGETVAVASWNAYTWETSTTADADNNGTVDGKDHAGKLLWDLTVIGGAAHGNGATLTTLYNKNSANYGTAQQDDSALSKHFTFLEGKGWRYALTGTTIPEWKTMAEAIIRASLQTGAPIQVGVTNHAIVCDGFGYHNSVPYFHLNYGWCGSYNCWVPLEWFWGEVNATYNAAFYQLVTNLQPVDVGCVIAGVVMKEGRPVAGVEVTCGALKTTTNSAGAYTFTNLEPETTYTVTCQDEEKDVTLGTFIDEPAREALQNEEANNKDENNPEEKILYDHGHAVVDFGDFYNPDGNLLASFYNFNITQNGDYSLVLNGNTAADDGTVTIKNKPIELSYTGAWAGTDGITVLMEYDNLTTNQKDMALVATSCGSTTIGVSVESDDGLGKGVNGTESYYNGTSTDERGTVAKSGVIVFKYKYDGSGDSTFAYDASGNVIYTSSQLKLSNGAIGKTLSLGGVGEALIADGMVIKAVRVYKEAIPQEKIAAIVQQFQDERIAFEWAPGADPEGWFTAWENNSGDTTNAEQRVVGAKGPETVPVVSRDKFTPWVGMTAKSNFTLATYGCADLVSSAGYSVLWAMGSKTDNKIALVKASNGHIQLLQVDGTGKVLTTIDGGIRKGYHLFTVRFKEGTGATLEIDGQEIETSAAFRKPSDGFQVGSVYQELNEGFWAGTGFIVKKMVGFDDSTKPTDRHTSRLCAEFPPIATTEGFTAENVAIPSLSLVTGEAVAKGSVTVAEVSVENGSTLDLTEATSVSGTSITVDAGTLRVKAGQGLACAVTISATGILDITELDLETLGAEDTVALRATALTLAEGATLRLNGAAPEKTTIVTVDATSISIKRVPLSSIANTATIKEATTATWADLPWDATFDATKETILTLEEDLSITVTEALSLGDVTLTGQGTVTLLGDKALTVTGTLTIEGGITLDVGANLPSVATLALNNGVTLAIGTAPLSPQALTVNGFVTIAPSETIVTAYTLPLTVMKNLGGTALNSFNLGSAFNSDLTKLVLANGELQIAYISTMTEVGKLLREAGYNDATIAKLIADAGSFTTTVSGTGNGKALSVAEISAALDCFKGITTGDKSGLTVSYTFGINQMTIGDENITVEIGVETNSGKTATFVEGVTCELLFVNLEDGTSAAETIQCTRESNSKYKGVAPRGNAKNFINARVKR